MLKVKARLALLILAIVWIGALAMTAPVHAQVQNGTVAGRVLNSDGAPIAGIVMDLQPAEAGVLFMSFPSIRTDSAGRFRISGVAPGRYRVIAGPVEFNPTYYPGNLSASEAAFVTMTPGATLENINITMARPAQFRVAGKIRRPPGTPANAPMLAKIGIADMYASPPADGTLPFLFEAGVAADGTFEFSKVPPGRYKLSPTPVVTAWTPLPFSVSDVDIANLDLIIPLEARATVRVTVDENIPLPPFSVAFAGPYGGRAAQQGMYSPTAPGPFSGRILYAAIPAGEHRVIVSGLPAPYFVKSITVGTKDLLRDPLTIESSNPIEIVVTLALPAGNGVKVAGRIIAAAGAQLPSSPVVSLYIPTTGSGVTTPMRPDGSFEFSRVPRGSYEATLAGSAALLYQPTVVVVSERDVANLEIVVPRRIQMRGKVVVEGGGPRPNPHLTFERPSVNSAVGVADDGTFEATLPEGEYRLRIGELPDGYFLKSATYGAEDLITQPLRLGSAPASDVLITIAARVPAPWRTVSGRVVGATAASPAYVQLVGNRGNFYGRTRPDGTFEIPEVLPGSYRAYSGSYNLPQPTLVVTDKDVSGIELIHRPFAPFRGRMLVEGGGPAARFELRFAGPNFVPGALSLVELQENGSFDVSLPEDEVSLAVTTPPPGYTVKSITYGGKDVVNGVAKFSSTDRQEILITFTPTSPPPWRKVSGRVVTDSPSGVKPSRVAMTASFGIRYQAPVAADGSFEFPKILPGTYQYLSVQPFHPSLSPSTLTIRVADADISGIEIRYPELFEVSGRAVLMDGSALPATPRWYLNSTPVTGNFKLLVRPGEEKISFESAGSPYRIVSAVYGAIDLLKEPLKLTARATGEILVTLAPSTPPPLSNGVTLGGRVTGDLSVIPAPRRVYLYNDDQQERKYAEVPLSADGSFEFFNIPPGRFFISPVGVPLAASIIARAAVVDRDIRNLDIRVFRSTEAATRVVMEDGSPLPSWTALYFYSTRTSEPLGTDIPANGRFNWTVSEDEQFLTVRGLPADYGVKSMTYGTVDLLKSSLKLNPTAEPTEIRITIGR